jgi:phage terminase large subunit
VTGQDKLKGEFGNAQNKERKKKEQDKFSPFNEYISLFSAKEKLLPSFSVTGPNQSTTPRGKSPQLSQEIHEVPYIPKRCTKTLCIYYVHKKTPKSVLLRSKHTVTIHVMSPLNIGYGR